MKQVHQLDSFLDPRCIPANLDRYVVRTAILGAVRDTLPRMEGTLLDVGCGRMPYRSMVLAPPSRVTRYIGLDLQGNGYGTPDLVWDGRSIPLASASMDAVMATEVFEHCPDPEAVMSEIFRVLRSGGLLFFTVPFLWPLHDVPDDHYRYTPFALDRHLRNVGFSALELEALGGWDASLAQLVGLWVRRRPMSRVTRAALSRALAPLIRHLVRVDRSPTDFQRNGMITGLSGRAVKPIR